MKRRNEHDAFIEKENLNLEETVEYLRKELNKKLGLHSFRAPRYRRLPGRRRGRFRRFLVIPDCQVKPGVPTDHLDWAGRYIAEKRPDVIVCLGDFWDFPSLSSHDSPVKKAIDLVDIEADFRAGNEAMARLTSKYRGIKGYAPEEYFLYGNHEDRVRRTVEDLPWYRGVVSMDKCDLRGWDVHNFLAPVDISGSGVLMSHFFANPFSGKPIGGTAHNLLRYVGKSCVAGHKQILDCALQQLPDGTQRRATVCGAFYLHDESYKGPQGNGHFRGLIVMNEVNAGMWDQLEVSINFLERKFG